jgi:hypothetical protein
MIWFNLQTLENKIVNDQLTDKDGLKYFFAILIITAIPFSVLNIKIIYHIDTLISFLILSIIVWGVIASYSVNKKIDNKDFFNRFFAISWLVGIRIILFIVISIIFMNTMTGIIPHHYFCRYGLVFSILGLIYIALIWIFNYVLIIRSLNRIRRKMNYTHAI